MNYNRDVTARTSRVTRDTVERLFRTMRALAVPRTFGTETNIYNSIFLFNAISLMIVKEKYNGDDFVTL